MTFEFFLAMVFPFVELEQHLREVTHDLNDRARILERTLIEGAAWETPTSTIIAALSKRK